MRADVADRAQLAAEPRVDAPVPVGVQQQPVLEVVAGDEADVAELAGHDHAVQVLAQRVEAQVVVHRVDPPARLGGAQEIG